MLLFLREIAITFTMMLTLFLFFFFRKILLSPSSLFLPFAFFFFGKILISCTCFFPKLFFVFLVILPFLYIEKKFIESIFQFLSSEFSSLEFSFEFSSSESSLSKSEEISILSIRYLDIFFSLTTHLNSSKNT